MQGAIRPDNHGIVSGPKKFCRRGITSLPCVPAGRSLVINDQGEIPGNGLFPVRCG
jgi:hypothetical protein